MFQMKDPNKKVESPHITKNSQRSDRIPNPLGKKVHPFGKRFPSVWENSLNPLGILFLPLDT